MCKTALGAAEADFRYGGGTLIDEWYEVRSPPFCRRALAAWGGGCCARTRPVTGRMPSDSSCREGVI